MFFNLADFGAKGDGITLNTNAFAAAMNAVRNAGGGTLLIPPGRWKTGTVALVSDLTLVIARGAAVIGSESPDDYRHDATIRYHRESFYLFEGIGVANVEITGGGAILGNGPAFWEDEFFRDWNREGKHGLPYPCLRRPKARRPHAVIYFSDSNRLRIGNLAIFDAPTYTIWLVGCEDAVIEGLTVRNDRHGPNTDVLDLDCSRRVRISNCDFSAGDDCIALKSDPNRTGTGFACENITVSNCVLSSVTCAVRIGYEGDAPIRDCVFSNLTIHDTRMGLDILSIRPHIDTMHIKRGTPIDRIIFNGITMRNVLQPFFIWAGNELPESGYAGHIRDLLFRDIYADATAGSFIGANIPGAIADITFEQVVLRRRDAHPELPPDGDVFPSHWGGARNSGALLRVEHAERLALRHFQATSERPGEEVLLLRNSTLLDS